MYSCLQMKKGRNDIYTLMKAPNELSVSIADLDAETTTRNSLGRMVRQRVRGGSDAVRTVKLKWQNISETDAQQLLDMVSGTYFWMKYPDPYTLGFREAQFYVGDRDIQIKRMLSSTLSQNHFLVKEVSFNCIER